MSWSFPVGHLFGSELRIHATFFLLLAWIGIIGWVGGGLAGALVHLLFVVVLFACVIAHEFGHALVARRYGIHTPDVTLLPIGGLARMERMPENPAQEVLVALGGPAVNLAIFFLLALILGPARLAEANLGEITLAGLPEQIALLNLMLAAFNMIPAFPMDGGRVLRALMAMAAGRGAATRIAAVAGQALAFVMGLTGLVTGNPILILIALFVYMSAGAESADEAMRALARGLLARDAMITRFEPLAPDDSLEAAGAALIRTTQAEFPVIDPASGALKGFLTRDGLHRALNAEPRPRNVAEAMTVDVPSVGLMDGLSNVLEKLTAEAPAVAVLSRQGQMIGYITRENMGELMVVAHARRSRRG